MHFPAVSSPWKQKLSIRFISNSKFLFLWGGYSCGVHEVIIVLFTATVQQNFRILDTGLHAFSSCILPMETKTFY